MRPLKLTMQAFGPFAGTEVLHFAQLGENPLFLINGPTGSGKTSLLDAMCLALYNSTTGNERQGNEMRCNQAEPELLTFVEFDFELNDVAYRIKRVPEQLRPAKHGDKLVKQNPTATLYRLGDDLSEANGALLVETKVKDANDAIKRLTGLSAEQFRQVMVLPQGEFRKLLLANSGEREKIFSSLFSTEIYSRLEQALKDQARDVKRKVQAQRDQLKGILATAEAESVEQLESNIAAQVIEVANANAALKVATDAWSAADRTLALASDVELAFSRLQQSEARAEQLNTQAQTFVAKYQQLSAANEALTLAPLLANRAHAQREQQAAMQAHEQALKHLATVRLGLAKATDALSTAERSQPPLDVARAQRVELESYRAKSDALIGAVARHEAARKTVAASGTAAATVSETKQRVAKAATELEQQLERQFALRDSLAAKPTELAQFMPLLDKRRQLAQHAKALATAQTKHVELGAGVLRSKSTCDTAKSTRDHMKLAWHRGQAAVLAAELQLGQPCPVCGSADHPQRAEAADDIATAEDVDRADHACQAAVSALQRVEADRDALANEVARLSAVQTELAAVLGSLATRDVAALEGELAALQADAARLDSVQNEIRQCNQTLRTAKQRLLEATAKLQTADAEAQEAAVALAASAAARSAAEAALPEQYRGTGALDIAITAVEKRIGGLEHALASAQAAHNDATTAQALGDAALRRADGDVINSRTAYDGATAVFAEALASSCFASERECESATMPAPARAQLQQEISSYEADCNAIKATIAAQQAQVQGKQRQDLPALTAAQAAALAEKERLNTVCVGLNNTLHMLEKVQAEYQMTTAAAAALDAQYAVVGTLADVANGQTGNKVSLQRFVLGVLLDDVLIQATQRLSTMSAGRYQLVRKAERSKGGGASGLEFMVYDDHSGTERSVATLSGGESFLAALSLALGLSDVVQSYAGGVRLDTLFIDEGFGSLDPDSLELAIRTLVDLQQGGRMVGVISHVTEMKEQMELRVDISKGLKGSHLRVVGPRMAQESGTGTR